MQVYLSGVSLRCVAVIHLGVFIVHVAESRGRKGLVSVLRGKCLCNVNSETDCRRRRRRVYLWVKSACRGECMQQIEKASVLRQGMIHIQSRGHYHR